MSNKKSTNSIKFVMEGVELSVNEAFESRVDDVSAAAVENVKGGALRRLAAYNRAAFNIQAVSFVYHEKAVFRLGKDDAMAAEADNCYVYSNEAGKERRHFVGYAKQVVMRLEESELSRLGTFKVAPNGVAYVSEKSGIASRVIKDFSDEVVLMDFTSASLGDGTNRLSQVLAAKTILKVEANGVCRWYMANEKGLYVDLRFNTSSKNFNKGVKITQFPKGAKISVYTPFAASASMQRGNSLYLLKADREELVLAAKAAQEAAKAKAGQEEIDRLLEEGMKSSYDKTVGKAAAIVNSLSGGVYERQMNSLKGEKISVEKRNKLASRMTLPITNSRRFGEVEKLAIANFDFPETDGHGWFNQDFLVKVFKEMYPEADVSETMFNGLWVQARLEASVKGGHTPIRKQLLAQLILAAAKKYDAEIVFLEQKNLTPAFYKYMDGKGSAIMKEKYDGKILVYGTRNLEEVEFFGDLTVFKTIPNMGEKLPVALMDTVAQQGKTCDTSNQVIAKLLQVNEALPVLKEMVKEIVDKKWAMEKKDITSFSELGSVDYGVDVLQKIAPEFIFRDEKLANSVMESLVKSSVNMVSNLNIPVEGFNAIMIPDYGFMFGIKLIADDEIFIPGSKYTGRRCQAVRHPSASSGEHVGLKAIGYKRVAIRLERYCYEGKISRAVCDLLQELFKSLKGNVTVMPINGRLVNLLGGADWDGDTANLYFDSRLVALLDQVPEEAIDYGSIKSSNELVEVDHRMMVDSYKSFVDCGNRPVGIVVNFITAMAGTLAAIENGKVEEYQLKNFLMYIKRAEAEHATEESKFDPENILLPFSYAGEYQRQFIGDNLFIDAARREEFAEYVKSVGVASPENFKMFLADMIKAYSGIANDIIDAAKKGGKVNCWFFGLSAYIKGGLKAPVGFGYDDDKNIVVKAPELGFVEGGSLYVSEDIGAELKIFGANLIREKIEEFKAKAAELQNLNEVYEENDAYGDVDFFSSDKEALKGLASINTKLNNGAPESYKDLKEDVLAFARYLAKAATSSIEERYELFKEASVMKDGSYSGFYTKFGPEAITLTMRERDFNLRSRLYSLVGDIVVESGDEIELVEGKAANGVFTEDKITGTFEVEVIDGVAYATKSAKEYLKGFMNDDKFVVELNTFNFLKDKVDLSGKNGINTTIAAANNLLKKEVDDLLGKMNSKEYSFKFMKYNGGLVLVPTKNAQGIKFPVSVLVPGKLGEGNAFIEALAGKEVTLDNVIQFNYYKDGTIRGKSIPQFVVALTGSIK